jgi:nitrate/TMAO reductase-like tetraheme cytochrome c subunit
MWKCEAENVTSCRDCHVLNPIDRVGHGRSAHFLTSIEVPESTTGRCINCFKVSVIISKKHQATGGG